MERFAIKIDKSVRLNLYNICRLCGIDNPNKVPILDALNFFGINQIDDEPDLCKKIFDCVGIQVTKNDQMPQNLCSLCADKINDFYEYREMCSATNIQTRRLLGLPENIPTVAGRKKKQKVDSKTDEGEIILGILGEDEDDKTNIQDNISQKPGRGRKRGPYAKTLNKEKNKDEIKDELDLFQPTEQYKRTKRQQQPPPMVTIMAGSGSIKTKKKSVTFGADTTPLLTLKAPNKRERTREIQDEKLAKARKRIRKQVENSPIPMVEIKKLKIEKPTMENVKCIVCSLVFLSENALLEHSIDAHSPIISEFGCSSCNECFKTLSEQKDHHIWHSLTKTLYTCLVCQLSFDKLETFLRHTTLCELPRSSEILENVTCFNCFKEFPTQNLHDWHDCFIVTNGVCLRCDRRFVKKNSLFLHMVKCTKNKVSSTVSLTNIPNLNEPLKNMVKTEPEANLDAEIDASDNENDYGDGGEMFEDDFHNEDSDDEGVGAIHEPLVVIKSEPKESNHRDSIDGNDSDVIIIEDEPVEPIVIGGDGSSPSTKRKEKKLKKHKKDKKEKQLPRRVNIKQEPTEMPDEELNEDHLDGDQIEPTIRIKTEPVDKLKYRQNQSKSNKNKIKKNKGPIVVSCAKKTVFPVIVKQEPRDEYETVPETEASSMNTNVNAVGDSLTSLPPQNFAINPLSINIKKEPLHSGYGDFDPEIARNIKKEKNDNALSKQPSLRLKITKEHGTLNAKIISTKVKPTNDSSTPSLQESINSKPKQVYKKPALLALKIRQEIMAREQAMQNIEGNTVSLPIITKISSGDGTQLTSDEIRIPIISSVQANASEFLIAKVKLEKPSPVHETDYLLPQQENEAEKYNESVDTTVIENTNNEDMTEPSNEKNAAFPTESNVNHLDSTDAILDEINLNAVSNILALPKSSNTISDELISKQNQYEQCKTNDNITAEEFNKTTVSHSEACSSDVISNNKSTVDSLSTNAQNCKIDSNPVAASLQKLEEIIADNQLIEKSYDENSDMEHSSTNHEKTESISFKKNLNFSAESEESSINDNHIDGIAAIETSGDLNSSQQLAIFQPSLENVIIDKMISSTSNGIAETVTNANNKSLSYTTENEKKEDNNAVKEYPEKPSFSIRASNLDDISDNSLSDLDEQINEPIDWDLEQKLLNESCDES